MKRSSTLLSLLTASLLLLSTTGGQGQNNSHSFSAVGTSAQYLIVQHPLPAGSEGPWSIATDSHGNVWVVEQTSNQLGMFDPSTNAFREFPIPTPNSTVNSVTVDGSGNVWITELTSNRLGELRNGSTSIIEYKIPNTTISLGGLPQILSCGPVEVIEGPSGSIWVSCLFSNQIDEFYPQNGTFNSFNLPVFQSGPAGLIFDHSGNFWFTAADANMIGNGIMSQLRNGTTDGITETAPLNSTYVFHLPHESDLQGDIVNITSSLPTPSGIAISPDGNTLWISEHVDSSFDSYNIATKSLDRFWTSQTQGAFGYPVSFPNGLAIDSSGDVWIAEHYGNKVAEFNPETDSLNEYTVPCCSTYAAGVYTLTLGQNGTVWFVEIQGNAIGELKPVATGQTFALDIGQGQVVVNKSLPAVATTPIQIQYNVSQRTIINLEVSGMTSTGSLANSSATFDIPSFSVTGAGTVSDNLTIAVQSIKNGAYYLTVSAVPSPGNVTYSEILKLVVGGNLSTNYPQLLTYVAVIGMVGAVLVIAVLSFRMKTKGRIIRKRHR